MKINGGYRERLKLIIDLIKTIGVVRNEYHIRLKGINVPCSQNHLSIEASNVDCLTMSVKFFLGVSKTVKGKNGYARYSLSNVPQGDYDIKIFGRAFKGASEVTLKITASADMQLDDEWYFIYHYNTVDVMKGEFSVKVDGMTRSVTIV